MREDALLYHQRVVNEFANALINKHDARDEAVNVLLSANNLENEGYTRIIFKKEAEEYLKPHLEVKTPTAKGMERIFSTRSTRHEAAPVRHHRHREQFDDKKWVKAMEEGNESAIDAMVRRYIAFRFQNTIPNVQERGKDIVGSHSKFKTLNLHPSRKGEVAYGEKPLWQHLMKYLHGGGGENALRLHKAMVKTAENMNPMLKQPHLFSNWRGNNASIMEFYRRGKEDFINAFAERYGKNHPLLSSNALDEFYLRQKHWENEGIPRQEVMDILYDENGRPQMSGQKGKSPVEVLRELADQYHDRRRKPLQGEANFGRVGDDAYRLGIAMLPYDDIYKIQRWMLETGGGMNEEGNIDDSVINKILGPDARGYMAHHAFLMDNMLNTLYAGGAERNGMSHNLPNRFLEKAREKVVQDIEQKHNDLRNRLLKNNWGALNEDTLADAFEGFDFSPALERYEEKNGDAEIIPDGGPFPYIDHNEYGTFVYLTDSIPDMKNLIGNNFFNQEELSDLIERSVTAYGTKEYADLLRQSVNNYTHTHNVDDEFDMLDEPAIGEEQLTPLGIVMQGVGSHRGNADGESGDFQVAYDSSMPNLLFAPLQERAFLMPRRGERRGAGRNRTVEQQDEFDPKKDVDGELRVDLVNTMERYGIENQDDYLAQYDAGNTVKLDVPREDLTTQDAAERFINPHTAEEKPDSLPDPRSQLEAFVKDMPSPKTPATRGLNSFYMAHSNNLDVSMKDHIGFFSLDGIPLQALETALKTPMFSTRKGRIGSQSNGRRTLLNRKQLPNDYNAEGARQIGITPNNLSQEDKMLIDALVLGSHHPLHQHDDDSLNLFNALMDAKKGERLKLIQEGNHKDVIGYAGRSGKDLMSEILREADEPSHFAIYHKEDYDKHAQKLLDFSQPYSIPEAQVKGIRSRRRLIQEIKALDQRYKEAFNAGDLQRQGELNEEIENMLNDKDNVVGYREHEDGLSALVVGPTPAYIASQHLAMLSRAFQLARNNGDEDAQERIEKRMMEVRQASPSYESGEIELNNHETRMSNMFDTLRGVEKIYKVLVNGIEKIKPGVYSKDNREAHAATAYTLKLAEQILTLSPDEKRKLFSGQNNIQMGGIKASFDLSPDEIEELVDLGAVRPTHGQSSFEAEKMVDSVFGGEQPKGHQVLSRLAGDSANFISQDELDIFEKIIANVDEASKKQGISWEDAFVARYAPINVDGEPITGTGRSEVYGYLGIGKDRSLGNFQYNEGGVFHGNEYTRSGGESVFDKKGNPINLQKEREAIFNLLNNANIQTREGSDTALDFKRMKFFRNNKPNYKTVMNFNKLSSLRNLAHLLNDETKTRILAKSNMVDEKVPLGGYDFKNAPVFPVHTSAAKKFDFGLPTHLPFQVRTDSFKNGKLFLEDEDVHTYNPPSPQQLYISPNMMRRVNPNLQPLTDGQRGDKYFPTYRSFENEPNHNQRLGQSVNQAMMMGTENLQSTDPMLFHYSSHILDVALDDTLLIKEDGKPQPVKFMHRIFDLDDMQHLRGFTGDWVISLYPQGEHVIATKDKKGITAYGVDGEVKLDEAILEEADKVYEKDFTVHAVLHDGLMTVIDLLKTADEDTHNMPTKDRIRHLRAQYESSEHIKMPEPINTKRSDDEGLQTAIDGLQKENNDVDILLRDANATYMKGESRHPKWVLLSKEKMVDVIILSASGTTYGIGVGPLMHPEHYGKRAQQVGEEHYMNVGSAKGPRGLKVGDFATVRCTGVSASNKEHPLYRIRSAKITDNEPFAANSVETLAIMSGEHHVPQQVSMKKGNITIHFPAFDDEVICKTSKENGLWYVEPRSSVWGNDYLVRLARDQEAYWITKAAWLLKEEDVEEPEYDEVEPEPPAGHSKKRKHVLEEEEEVIKRGLELAERGLEHLAKEKITSTGVQGLGIGYATPDEHPRGPTQNINDETLPDFDPAARADDELKPATAKKTKRLRSTEGEEARLEDEGVIAIDRGSLDIA